MKKYRSEFYSNRIAFMLKCGFKKVEQFDNYIIANDRYCYSYSWLENDYIFYKKICNV
jgi:hypothetical protein